MLPLVPPSQIKEPGYPKRTRLLGDAMLRQRAFAVLAAVALTGCGGTSAPHAETTPAQTSPMATEELVIPDLEIERYVTVELETASPIRSLGEMAVPQRPEPSLVMGVMGPVEPLPSLIEPPPAPTGDT